MQSYIFFQKRVNLSSINNCVIVANIIVIFNFYIVVKINTFKPFDNDAKQTVNIFTRD
jgi:hypothetical protein